MDKIWRSCRTNFWCSHDFYCGNKNGWTGHLGFYAGEDADSYRILGGNQNNSVCYTWIAKERLLDNRWPRTATHLWGSAGIVAIDCEEDLSTNES